jgi:(4S)-4-hydroxy-5-phosphonooxypentane-2,3-dione isomerase
MLIVTVIFKVRDAHRDAFLSAIVDNAQQSLRSEEGCKKFDVCRSEDGSIVFLYEQYVDDAAFDLHLKSRHFLQFNELSSPWIADKRVDRYTLVG